MGRDKPVEEANKNCYHLSCRLRAGLWAGQSPLCSWHFAVEMKEQKDIHFRSFQEFQRELIDGLYCSYWTHFGAEYLWAKVSGQNHAPENPMPCKAITCTVKMNQILEQKMRSKELKYEFTAE